LDNSSYHLEAILSYIRGLLYALLTTYVIIALKKTIQGKNMSNIRFFALGGLSENGKNMYVFEINGNLYILDAGIKYPSQELFGVDEIVPDYRILLRAEKKIKGIFLSHAHEDHIGAIPHLLKELNVPIYATKFTMQVLKDRLLEEEFELDKLTLNIIHAHSIINFGDVRISFFKTTHNIPESVGIAIHTTEGVIVYTSDFTFEQVGDERYQTDFKKINEIAEKDVLALLIESVGSNMHQTGGLSIQLKQYIKSVFTKAEHRIIVSLFSSDLHKIQQVINISIEHHKKIAIIGRRAQRIVDIAISEGYLEIPEENLVKLKFLDETNKNNADDIVCLVTGNRHESFYMLQRMANKQDRLIHIEENDTILVMTPPVPGTEKMASRTLDILYRSNAKIVSVDKNMLSYNHASSDEIKMMIQLFKPKYIIPTIGEYRHQYALRELAKTLLYKEEQVLLLDNGDVVNFTGKDMFVGYKDIKVGEILIDGTSIGDVNDFVMKDRELLAEDGALIIVSHINPKTKELVGVIEIVTKGFVYIQQSESLLLEIKELFKQTVTKHLQGKYINWNELKRDVRNEISRFVYQETKRNPITIPVLISVD
jgi:ribonuclease J